MRVDVIENKKTGVFIVKIDGEEFGSFSDIDDGRYSYFPTKQDKLTGDHYIAIGNALNKINSTKH